MKLEVTRAQEAKEYNAPKHFGMSAKSLQGGNVTSVGFATVGFSRFTPGGGAEMSASTVDRIYIVTEGTISVETAAEAVQLGEYDSCYIPAGLERKVINRSDCDVLMLVVQPAK